MEKAEGGNLLLCMTLRNDNYTTWRILNAFLKKLYIPCCVNMSRHTLDITKNSSMQEKVHSNKNNNIHRKQKEILYRFIEPLGYFDTCLHRHNK